MKRIAGSYVYWYNWKYYRKGHLFQDRFKSEVIEDESYFLTVLRYIHQNPVKSGIVKNIDKYKYSSYNDYINNEKNIVDTEFALSMLSKESFVEFNNESNDDICLDINDKEFRINDIDAREILKKVSQCANATEFQQIEQKQRDECIKKLKDKGLSIRQISRLTGVSFTIVRKI